MPFKSLAASIGTSITRTAVPYIVGLIIALALKANVELDATELTGAVTFVVGTVYYAIVRFAEEKLSPAWGWLLLKASSPTYTENS